MNKIPFITFLTLLILSMFGSNANAEIANCTAYNSARKYTACKSGYYLGNNSCLPEYGNRCGDGCSSCDNGYCRACEIGCWLNSTYCETLKPCVDHCSVCTSNVYTTLRICRSCEDGYTLNGNNCIEKAVIPIAPLVAKKYALLVKAAIT